MSSQSLATWNTERQAELDEIEAAHKAVGGTGRGRRYATQQINRAYAMLLSSQFQAFSRDLHSEASDHIANSLASATQGLRDICFRHLSHGRRLDRGNANPASLGSDFGRLFTINFWEVMEAPAPVLIPQAKKKLHELNLWRNAIAHQDFTGDEFQRCFSGRVTLSIREVREWRKACKRLAIRMDTLVANHLELLTGMAPW
jgi:hypothetical protein